jgi:hypothetical protein
MKIESRFEIGQIVRVLKPDDKWRHVARWIGDSGIVKGYRKYDGRIEVAVEFFEEKDGRWHCDWLCEDEKGFYIGQDSLLGNTNKRIN